MADPIIASLKLVGALFLVFLNGFFVASEFAFVRLRESSVRRMEEEGVKASSILTDVIDELDDYLAVTQLGITISSLGLGWLGEPAVASLLEIFIQDLLPSSVLHIISFSLGFAIITFLHVVFGELAPKTLSIQRTEKIATLVAAPMKVFRILFKPGIVVFNGSANKFTELLGIEPASETSEEYSEEELKSVLSRSSTSGLVDESEVSMIERVFELDDMKVKEVMVPQPDVQTLRRDQELNDVQELATETNHTRYPVIEEEGREVFGFVDVKDIFSQTDENGNSEKTVEDIMSEIVIIPESSTVNEALGEFKEHQIQMLAVIDEWGVFEGIVTAEDVVEVVVGDLRDKYDRNTEEAQIVEKDNSYLVQGGVSLAELEKNIESNLNRKGIDTVGGLLLSDFGEVPSEGDSSNIDGHKIEVVEMDDNRIKKAKISKKETS